MPVVFCLYIRFPSRHQRSSYAAVFGRVSDGVYKVRYQITNIKLIYGDKLPQIVILHLAGQVELASGSFRQNLKKAACCGGGSGREMGASPESKPPGLTLSATLNHLLLLGCPRVGQFVGLSLWVLSGNGDDFEQKNIKRSARECRRADDEFNNPSGWCFAFHVVQGVI